MAMNDTLSRVQSFCDQYELRIPILMAPMAGACPTELAIGVARAGGMGACGALLMDAEKIGQWATGFRAKTNGAFQLNTWIPDPTPKRSEQNEADLRTFLGQWGPKVQTDAADKPAPDFDAQCAAILAAGPHVVSSIMGLYPPAFVEDMKARGIKWFATVTTVTEARAAADAGADAIVAQGSEAGGHRGAFDADMADNSVGLMALLPAVVDAVDLPVIATGGIADGRGVAAALLLGASAVQIGTGLLRTPEAGIASSWADALAQSLPEDTVPTRAFSGRLGRAVRNDYTTAAEKETTPAPYPIQRSLTQAMRDAATKENDISRLQAWAGQSSALASAEPVEELLIQIWQDAQALLGVK